MPGSKNEHFKNEHFKNEQLKNEYFKNEHFKNEHFKNEQLKNEHFKKKRLAWFYPFTLKFALFLLKPHTINILVPVFAFGFSKDIIHEGNFAFSKLTLHFFVYLKLKRSSFDIFSFQDTAHASQYST